MDEDRYGDDEQSAPKACRPLPHTFEDCPSHVQFGGTVVTLPITPTFHASLDSDGPNSRAAWPHENSVSIPVPPGIQESVD